MQFHSEQILEDGSTLKFIVICGIPPGGKSLTTAEGLYIKRPDDTEFRIAVSMVSHFLNDNRVSELMTLRASLVQPYLIEGTEKIHLPFVITLRLRAEAWLKAEPFLEKINAGGRYSEIT